MENILSIASIVVVAIVVPATAWLLRTLLKVKEQVLVLEQQFVYLQDHFQRSCKREEKRSSAMYVTLNRLERNLLRLCDKTQVQYEAPSK